MKVAALYVETDGVYFGLPDVEPWDAARDARLYAGPWPVVAHPPCERWGRYWNGGPSWKGPPKAKGDDGGCFAAALAAVRRWGGVLEHPADSHAWAHFGLRRPPARGGWVVADFDGGWTCRVEQGGYGHRGHKATWLYAARVEALPSLPWNRPQVSPRRSPSWTARLAAGATTAEHERARRTGVVQSLSRKQRQATPLPFRDLLLGIARGARRRTSAWVAS